MSEIIFPCLTPIWVAVAKIEANDYNPNEVPAEERRLLRLSIAEDGLTQAPVAWYDRDHDLYVIIDGFHRFGELRDWFGCSHIPLVVLDKTLAERMAATIRHNRARGKHQILLMEALVRTLTDLGWSDGQIAKHLGMQAEEVLRLKAERGIAAYYARREYSRSWVWIATPEDGTLPDVDGAGVASDE